jgi:hypothetical protein
VAGASGAFGMYISRCWNVARWKPTDGAASSSRHNATGSEQSAVDT